jgi:hypothetical protein
MTPRRREVAGLALAATLGCAWAGPARADLLRQLLLNDTTPSWLPLIGGRAPSKYEDYAAGHYWYNGRAYGSYTAFAAAVGASFSRASAATYTSPAAAFASVGSNVLRFDCPTGVAQGLLLEGASVNSLRNNTMQGVAAGSPGTLPTDWVASSTFAGLSRQIVGSGTESGINYVDIRYFGTTSGSASGATLIGFDGTALVAAVSGQTWTGSAFITLVGGSLANVSLLSAVLELDNSGSFLAKTQTSITPAAGSLPAARTAVARILSNASTAFVMSQILATMSSGVAVDFTLRIGWPQLEQNPFASSPILTTGAAVTRAADALNNPWTIGSAFTKVVKVVTPPGFAASNMTAWELDDGSSSNRFILIYNGSTGHLNLVVASGGATQATIDLGAASANTPYTIAFAAQANSFRASVNGGAVISASSGSMPVGVTTERLGNNPGGGADWDGHFGKAIFFPTFANDNAIANLAANQ